MRAGPTSLSCTEPLLPPGWAVGVHRPSQNNAALLSSTGHEKHPLQSPWEPAPLRYQMPCK